jgi:hypothetical protein
LGDFSAEDSTLFDSLRYFQAIDCM